MLAPAVTTLGHGCGGGSGQAEQCVRAAPGVLSAVLTTYHPTVWIVSDRVLLAPLLTDGGHVIAPLDPRRVPIIERLLRTTLNRLTASGAEVVLVGVPPPGAPPQCGSDVRGSVCGVSTYNNVADPAEIQLDRIYREVADAMKGHVFYVSITDVLCPLDGWCPAVVGGGLARYDQVHYTATFSRRIVPIIIRRAERAGVSFAPLRGRSS
jgi:SGNH domain-containing protein